MSHKIGCAHQHLIINQMWCIKIRPEKAQKAQVNCLSRWHIPKVLGPATSLPLPQPIPIASWGVSYDLLIEKENAWSWFIDGYAWYTEISCREWVLHCNRNNHERQQGGKFFQWIELWALHLVLIRGRSRDVPRYQYTFIHDQCLTHCLDC